MHKKSKGILIVLNSNLISDDKIDELVISSAKDSIDYDIQNNKVFLYNNAEIKYGSITLRKAAYIELDSDKNIVFAKSLVNDSTGENYGHPIFTEDGKSFTSKEITYNFSTKKGIIKKRFVLKKAIVIYSEKKSRKIKMTWYLLLVVGTPHAMPIHHIFLSRQKELKLFLIRKLLLVQHY